MSSWKDMLEDFLVQFPRKYAERRAQKEGFRLEDHSFYVHDPTSQFIALLLTGTITDFYYMSKEEVFQYSIALHKKIFEEDPEFYKEAVRLARELATIKDQALIAALITSKVDPEFTLELLKTLPPNQIVKKYINAKRANNPVVGGLGTREKKILRELLRYWFQEDFKWEYYVAKYRRYMRDIINLCHYPIDPKEFSYISNPTKYEGESEYLKRISEFLKTKNPEVLPWMTPWNIIRSNLKKELWKEVFYKADITGNTIVLQAVSLYQALGDIILNFVDRALRSPTVTADKILKACLVAHKKGYNNLAQKLAKAYAQKVVDTYKKLLLPLEKPRILAILDASGSMNPGSWRGVFFRGLTVIAPFAPLIVKLLLFDNNVGQKTPELLKTFNGILRLHNIAEEQFGGGTCVECALRRALEILENNQEAFDTIILITDEQANIITNPEIEEMELIRRLLDKGITVIIINPTPYPVKITDIRDKRIIYVPAMNPEAVLAALRLAQIRKTSPNAHELLVKMKATYKKKKQT